jgi:hypothetical protein
MKILSAGIFKEREILELFDSTLQMMKLWNEEVLDAWLEVFGKTLELLPAAKVEKEARDAILAMSSPSQPNYSRQTAANMISYYARTYQMKFFDGQIYFGLREMIRDDDVKVRRIVGEKVLIAVAESIETSYFESIFIPTVTILSGSGE